MLALQAYSTKKVAHRGFVRLGVDLRGKVYRHFSPFHDTNHTRHIFFSTLLKREGCDYVVH